MVKPVWRGAEVRRVVCDAPEKCRVMVQVNYFMKGDPISTPLWEVWVLSGGDWWASGEL